MSKWLMPTPSLSWVAVGRSAALAVLWCVMLPGSGLRAQALRDPTVAPAGVFAVDPSVASDADDPANGAMSVIVRDGKPYLVVGTRLYAQGQVVGRARIERIAETEVWLREGTQLRKVPRYTGVQRSRAAPASCATAAPGRGKSARHADVGQPASPMISCDPAKP